jgi:hypothetical protein
LKRIHQDLADAGATVHYDSLRRYARRLGASRPLPFRRMECAAGEEAQVDFGTGAPVIDAEGKRRKTHVFRIVLSHSRKGYSEVTFRQTTEDFLRALENSFRHFGGAPKTLVIDNLKAAVGKAAVSGCLHVESHLLAFGMAPFQMVDRGMSASPFFTRGKSGSFRSASWQPRRYRLYRLRTLN